MLCRFDDSSATGSYYLYEFPLRKRRISTTTRKLLAFLAEQCVTTCRANEFPDGAADLERALLFWCSSAPPKTPRGPARAGSSTSTRRRKGAGPCGQYIGSAPRGPSRRARPGGGLTAAPNLFAEIDDASNYPADDSRRPRLQVAAPGSSTSTGRTRPTRPSGNHGLLHYALDCRAVRAIRSASDGASRPELRAAEGGGPQALHASPGDRLMSGPLAKFADTRRGRQAQRRALPDARGCAGTRARSRRAARRRSTSRAAISRGPGRPLWRWMGSSRWTRPVASPSASALRGGTTTRASASPAAPEDPAGQMTQTDHAGFTGDGPQTEIEGPGATTATCGRSVDHCTFWYTQGVSRHRHSRDRNTADTSRVLQSSPGRKK